MYCQRQPRFAGTVEWNLRRYCSLAMVLRSASIAMMRDEKYAELPSVFFPTEYEFTITRQQVG